METASMIVGIRWKRIVPIVFLMYTISYFSRVNISLTLPSISKELHISSGTAGIVRGIFFWDYVITVVIGGWLAPKFGPNTNLPKHRPLPSLVSRWIGCDQDRP